MKLISMTDFVLKTYDEIQDPIDSESMMFNYARFLKQPLELWMFDENDKRCLFNGFFDVEKTNIIIKCFSNIEALSNLNKNLQLTKTAIKQLGL